MCDETRSPDPNPGLPPPTPPGPPPIFDDTWLDMALRQGLRELDVPEPSADFDAKVMAAVRGRSLWRDMFLSYLRPAMATASAAAVVTLLLVHIVTRPARHVVAAAPAAAIEVEVPAVPRAPQSAGPIRAPGIERTLESPRPTYPGLMPLRDAARRDAHKKPNKPARPVSGAHAKGPERG